MPIQWDTRVITVDYETARRKARLAKQQRNIYQKCPPWAVALIWGTTGLLVAVWARILYLALRDVVYAVTTRL